RPTRVERVRGRGDVHVDHRVAGAVLPGRGVFRGPGGTGQVRRVRTLVPEDHGTVPRMDSLLHDVLLPIGSRPLDGEAGTGPGGAWAAARDRAGRELRHGSGAARFCDDGPGHHGWTPSNGRERAEIPRRSGRAPPQASQETLE